MIVANRRSFLAGLVSACAAPAIVTSSGFRAGIFLPRCHERWIAAYDCRWDRFFVRADFAKHELARPAGVQFLPPHLVARMKAGMPHMIGQIMKRVAEPGFQQHGFDWTLTAMRAGDMHESSVEASIERGLEVFKEAPGLGLLQIAPGVRGGVG
jgi:hypothetical protein